MSITVARQHWPCFNLYAADSNAIALNVTVRRTARTFVSAPTPENPRATREVPNPDRGIVIDVEAERVRVQWLNKDGSNKNRTWLAKKQFGKTWALA